MHPLLLCHTPSSCIFLVSIPILIAHVNLSSTIPSRQWAAGFSTFWYPGGSRNSRASLLPWHVFFGIYIYALAVATCTTGILEKATFLQTNHIILRYSTEALLVNSMGVLIVVLCGLVILAVVSPVSGKGDVMRD